MPSESTVPGLGVLAQSVGSPEDSEETVLGSLHVLEERRGTVVLVDGSGDGGELKVGVDLTGDLHEVSISLEGVDEGTEVHV